MDESHSTGFIGKTGRGTPEHFNVQGKMNVISSTLGKALGGGTGGYLTGRGEIIALMRQRARPYLFSNSVTPCIIGASLETFNILSESTEKRDKLAQNT